MEIPQGAQCHAPPKQYSVFRSISLPQVSFPFSVSFLARRFFVCFFVSLFLCFLLSLFARCLFVSLFARCFFVSFVAHSVLLSFIFSFLLCFLPPVSLPPLALTWHASHCTLFAYLFSTSRTCVNAQLEGSSRAQPHAASPSHSRRPLLIGSAAPHSHLERTQSQ